MKTEQDTGHLGVEETKSENSQNCETNVISTECYVQVDHRLCKAFENLQRIDTYRVTSDALLLD